MLLKTFKLKKIYFIIFISILLLILLSTLVLIKQTCNNFENESTNVFNNDYIKWIDFNATETILQDTANLDIKSHNENYDIKFNWIELLAYLSSKYYGHLETYKKSDLDTLVKKLNFGEKMEDLKDFEAKEFLKALFN